MSECLFSMYLYYSYLCIVIYIFIKLKFSSEFNILDKFSILLRIYDWIHFLSNSISTQFIWTNLTESIVYVLINSTWCMCVNNSVVYDATGLDCSNSYRPAPFCHNYVDTACWQSTIHRQAGQKYNYNKIITKNNNNKFSSILHL